MELEVLKRILVEVLSVDVSEIHMETTFMGDLGADSLDGYQIVLKLEDALGVQFGEQDIRKTETVGQAVELIRKCQSMNGTGRQADCSR